MTQTQKHISLEATCLHCEYQQNYSDPDDEVLLCENCGELIYIPDEELAHKQKVWQKSGPQGRILHLITITGLAQCGRQFDPQKIEEPKVTSNSPTMPYCQRCMTADIAFQNKAQCR